MFLSSFEKKKKLQQDHNSESDNSNFSLTLTLTKISWNKKKKSTFKICNKRVHTCLSALSQPFTRTLYVTSNWCLQGLSREQSQFGPSQVGNYLYNYLHISLAKRNLPRCFTANYSVIVVDAIHSAVCGAAWNIKHGSPRLVLVSLITSSTAALLSSPTPCAFH